MMTNLIALTILCLAASVHGYFKYGRSCKYIECFYNEVCVLVEDPCTTDYWTDCGTYPICKKKSLTGTTTEPATPAEPASYPQYPLRPRHQHVPNYGRYGGSSGGYGTSTKPATSAEPASYPSRVWHHHVPNYPPHSPPSSYPSVPSHGNYSRGYNGSYGGYGNNTERYGSDTGYPGINGGYQQHGGYNTSYSQPRNVTKNSGKRKLARSGAMSRKPASYGWNLGMSLVCLMAAIGVTHH